MFRLEIGKGIWKFDSGKEGKTVVIMAWMEGEEHGPSDTIRDFIDELNIVSGKIYYIAAHPLILKKERKQNKKSMNELFIDIPKNSTDEDIRVQDIIPFLRESDILLTIGYEEKESFFDTKNLHWATFFDTNYIFTGMESLKPERSESYMNQLGKIGLYLWTGGFMETFIRKNIQNFLLSTGNIEGELYLYKHPKTYHLYKALRAPNPYFYFAKKWKEVEKIAAKEEIAHYENMTIRCPFDGIIAFPRIPRKIGDVMCVLGKKVP